MAEVIDYTKYLPERPPESVVMEIRKRYFTKNYIVYKRDVEYDDFLGKCVYAACCRCTACGEGYYQELTKRAACGGSGYIRVGFHDAWGNRVFDGDTAMCPVCGEECKALHVSRITNYGYGKMINRRFPVTVHNIAGSVAVLYWFIGRYIDRDGIEKIDISPYDGYLFFKKKRVCVTGREPVPFNNKKFIYQWKQLKRYRVDVGSTAGEEIFFIGNSIEGTEAENCKLDIYCDSSQDVRPVRYMELWQRFPNVENLVMQGFGDYLNHLMEKCDIYDYRQHRRIDITRLKNSLDLKKTKPHEIIGISKAEFCEIRKRKLKVREIEYYLSARKCGVTIDSLTQAMQVCHEYDMKRIAPFGADIEKTMRYINKQKTKYPYDITSVTYLTDYWTMAQENGEDMTQNDVLFPARLKNAHDAELRKKKWKEDEKRKSLFEKRLKELGGFCYSAEGLSIHPATSESEMIIEGKLLKHCVATYANRHARGETSVFFIRHEDKPDEPYFTLEFDFKNMRVVQNRGLKNCARTPEVEAFEKKWVTFVKRVVAKERKAA